MFVKKRNKMSVMLCSMPLPVKRSHASFAINSTATDFGISTLPNWSSETLTSRKEIDVAEWDEVNNQQDLCL